MAPSPPDKPSAETAPKTRPPKRRNWRRRFVVLSVLLLVLGWLANGPAARWALRYGIEGAMESLGMSGNVTIEGTVLSGLALRDLNYSGDEGIESIALKKLTLEYKLGELLHGEIRGLDAESVELVIDYAKFPETEETEQDDTAALRETLTTIRPYLTSPRMSLSGIRVTLLNDGKNSASFQLAALEHGAGSGVYQFSGFQASDAGGQQTPLQDAALTWHPESATLDRLEILPGIALENTRIDWASTLQGGATLLADGAVLDLTLTDTLTLKLEQGEIRSAYFNDKFSLGLPTAFVIDALHADISDWDQAIPLWQVSGNIGVKSLDLDDYAVRNTSIELAQKNATWKIKLNGMLNGADIQSGAEGSWTAPESDAWWGDTTLKYTLKGKKLPTLAKLWLPEELKINLNQTEIDIEGGVRLEKLDLIRATVAGTTDGARVNSAVIPKLHVGARYQDDTLTIDLNRGETTSPRLHLSGHYHLKKNSYQGTLTINESDPAWMNALARAFDAPVTLEKNIQLKWTGSGHLDLEKPQTGNLTIGKLTFSTPDSPSIQLKGQADYDWPKSIKIADLEAREGDWLAKAGFTWDGNTLDLHTASLTNKGEAVADLTGSSPFNSGIKSAADFFKQDQPWNLSVKSKPLALKKLNDWLSLDLTEGIAGNASVDLNISGSPSAPAVNGDATLLGVTGLDAAQRDPISALLRFRSEKNLLHITSTLTEGKTERLKGKFTLPFEFAKLLSDPDLASRWLDSAKLEGTASINTLSLERFSRFIPELKKIQGTVNGSAKLSGTLSNPRYSVDIQGKAPLIQLRESDFGDIKDVKLTATIDDSHKLRARMTAAINGGKFEVSGTADLTDTDNPSFDLTVTTRYALAYRDDLVSVRANTDLRIHGTQKDATISGKIGIVESLVYKDMELIPIGVPSSAVAQVQLPALDAERAASGLPVPEPFGDWKLDVNITTTDPILIRGNIASGHITGTLKVGGTLADPRPDGTLVAEEIKTRLPFSLLNVKRGEIRFTPKGGLDPTLSVHGKSTVGSHDVSVFVYGRASSPRTTLTSFPPLPESEIMSLLGTGTTTSGLADRDVATFKAFQIFLMKLKQRADKPGGNRLFKNLLNSVEDLNLRVGENDRFTGRKFSSATIELNPRWHFTAQVDAQQKTRGLIVYVIRFR